MKPYYEAYDDRYKTIHQLGLSWSSDIATPIVLQVADRYRPSQIFEIGCGEGRDARAVLDAGYRLLAADVSPEAIRYCKNAMPQYADCFICMDCLCDNPDAEEKWYDMIYSVAVIHMLVSDGDRRRFYRFIHQHLTDGGMALICTMGNGNNEMQTDINTAFTLQERDHLSGRVKVAATSCRMVSFRSFERELAEGRFQIIEKGITESPPDFNSLMYAVVRPI